MLPSAPVHAVPKMQNHTNYVLTRSTKAKISECLKEGEGKGGGRSGREKGKGLEVAPLEVNPGYATACVTLCL